MTGSFDAMRARLIQRGLLAPVGGDFRLTDAGNAYVDRLIAEHKRRDASGEFARPTVRWSWERRPVDAGEALAA